MTSNLSEIIVYFLFYTTNHWVYPTRKIQSNIRGGGLRNAFSLYDGYFKYASCTTSCNTGWADYTRTKKKDATGFTLASRGPSIVTLLLTLTPFAKHRRLPRESEPIDSTYFNGNVGRIWIKELHHFLLLRFFSSFAFFIN